MRNSFAEYHPFNNFIYFALVTTFSLMLNHPLAQLIALVCALAYAVSVNGIKSFLFMLKYCLPTVFLTALLNPVFNHRGETILFYANDNPITLESIFYGISAGIMLVTVLVWFLSFNKVFTSDKFVYLFGRIIPSLSLVLSMSLGFVPKFKAQMEMVSEAQKSIGRDVSSGTLFNRAKTAILIFSIMLTWSLENAITTADSMKSRGYGLRGRTSFSIYRFGRRDRYLFAWFGFCGMFLIFGILQNAFEFNYFPSISYAPLNITTIPFFFVFFALCITPVLLNLKEERRWKTLVSKI